MIEPEADTTSPSRGKPLALRVAGIHLAFGGLTVLDDVSLTVEEGATHGLIGPNGAGKTSLFNCISGHYQPTRGSIQIREIETFGNPPSKKAALGLARTFQHPVLQPNESVLENVLSGAHLILRGGLISWSLRVPSIVRPEKHLRENASEILETLGVPHIASRLAGSLPHAHKKRVGIARALIMQPRVLLLDEPASGLSPSEVEDLEPIIRRLTSKYKLTTIIVEHHMALVSAVSERVTVLVSGRNIVEGTPTQVQSDPRVISAYLGAGTES